MQLVSFSVSNFKSIKNEATISFVADERDPSHSRDLIDIRPFGALLPSIALYGANGAGKSNLISALVFLRDKFSKLDYYADFIPVKYGSTKNTKLKPGTIPDDYWADIPRYINESGIENDEPTMFRLNLLNDAEQVLYEYMISFQNNLIQTERFWIQKPKGKRIQLFNREKDAIEINDSLKKQHTFKIAFSEEEYETIKGLSLIAGIDFGKVHKDASHKEEIHELTPFIITRRSEYAHFSAFCSFLENQILDYGGVSYNPEWISIIDKSRNRLLNYNTKDETVKSLLKDAELKTTKRMVSLFNYFGCRVTDFVFSGKKEKGRNKPIINFVYGNRTICNEHESTGNQKLLGIVFMILKALNYGGVLLFDEIESGLHEIAAFKLIELLHSINGIRRERCIEKKKTILNISQTKTEAVKKTNMLIQKLNKTDIPNNVTLANWLSEVVTRNESISDTEFIKALSQAIEKVDDALYEIVYSEEASENHQPQYSDEIIARADNILDDVSEITDLILRINEKYDYRELQLLFSTHNTNLLDPNLMRKDQIWFSKKNDNGSSEFYSLSDFSDVGIVDDFQRDYLRGSYDSIPTSNETSDSVANDIA